MKIALIDVDGHNFPNLALMKLSAYHKARGDHVEWWNPLCCYDVAYQSKVFSAEYSRDNEYIVQTTNLVCGGTGYDLKSTLPEEVERIMPDYSLYGIKDTAYGFLTRGCPRQCPWCIVTKKEGCISQKVADVAEFWAGQKNIVIMSANLLACKEHMDVLKQLAATRVNVDINQGLDCRLLTDENIDALNRVKLLNVRFAWDSIADSDAVLHGLGMYLESGAIKDERRRLVYVLTNFNTTLEEDLYRVYRLREMRFNPYVMIYGKQSAPVEAKRLQRWVNNKYIWWPCAKFEDYMKNPATAGRAKEEEGEEDD